MLVIAYGHAGLIAGQWSS